VRFEGFRRPFLFRECGDAPIMGHDDVALQTIVNVVEKPTRNAREHRWESVFTSTIGLCGHNEKGH
jgi:hypothetical protein